MEWWEWYEGWEWWEWCEWCCRTVRLAGRRRTPPTPCLPTTHPFPPVPSVRAMSDAPRNGTSPGRPTAILRRNTAMSTESSNWGGDGVAVPRVLAFPKQVPPGPLLPTPGCPVRERITYMCLFKLGFYGVFLYRLGQVESVKYDKAVVLSFKSRCTENEKNMSKVRLGLDLGSIWIPIL